MPTKVAIVGATGYVGGELARLALGHPEITLVAAIARSRQGEPLRAVQPHLHSAPESLVVGSDVGDAEVVFTALPAGEAAKQAPGWIDEGRAAEAAYLYGRIDESVRPYGVPKHRHTPEIAQEAARIGGFVPRLTFTPHLVPMTRGLIATCYAPLRAGVTARDIADAYARQYAEEPFVRVTASFPATKATLGSNWCLVHAVVDEPSARLVAFAVLDNLVKGAAGSALQNFNAMRGYPETMGLEALPLWP